MQDTPDGGAGAANDVGNLVMRDADIDKASDHGRILVAFLHTLVINPCAKKKKARGATVSP